MRLAPAQRQAAGILKGPVRVVAGAGTGKTAVLAERFRRLVQAGVRPESILVMTFSERAAAEMRLRIRASTGLEPEQVGTFHALAMRWLREDGRRIGIPAHFRILAGADLWIAVRELMWELGNPLLVGEERPDDLVAPLLKAMERLKQELVPLDRVARWCAEAEDRERGDLLAAAVELFAEHARRTRSAGWLDFDDLLVEAARLLGRPDVGAAYRARFPYLMVDEYQDTNLAQERLVELLAGPQGNVFVVGDDDQSIYRFRGASVASMERFLRVFPGAAGVGLGQNRRSSRSIVTVAAALVAHNAARLPKEITASGRMGLPVRILEAPDGGTEAEAIAERIRRLLEGGTPAGAIAVLCRTNAIARPVAGALEAAGIPFVQPGAGIYAQPAVRDVIALLRVIADPDDRLALARVVTRPPLELELRGPVAEALSGRPWEVPALQLMREAEPRAPWLDLLDELHRESARLGVDDLFFELMSRSHYLEIESEPKAVAAVTRLGELIAEFCERSNDHALGAWLGRLDLELRSGYDPELPGVEGADRREAVQVMTIHQAKGLEFDAVFVPALVEGRLPQPHRGEGFELPPELLEAWVRGREDHVAEERRLLYVAMTRARRELVLSWAHRYEGARRWRRSRFLNEVASGRRWSGEVVAARAEDDPAPAPSPAFPPAAPLSFSSVATYRECPRQHWFRYRVGLPAQESVEAQFGTLVHRVLMRAARVRQAGDRLDGDRLMELYEAAWAEVELADERRRPVLFELGRRQLCSLLAAGGLEAAPYAVESAFTATLDGWRLKGIIDRVDFPPPTQTGGEVGEIEGIRDGAWRIVDYKTGSPRPASQLRRDLQLALYALGAREALGLDPIELEIVYLRDGRRVPIPVTDELLESARTALADAGAGIAAGRFEPRPERRRCGLCSYRLACDSAL
ncbi:MAG TPA: ATP-dependent DNA helicase [Candidatus Dormibacteraeota bacterium]